MLVLYACYFITTLGKCHDIYSIIYSNWL